MGHPRRVLLVVLLLSGCALLSSVPADVSAQERATGALGVYIDRGILDYDDKKYSDALENFLEALRIHSENPDVRYFLGITYLALDQIDQAIVHLEKARELAPNDVDIAFNLGVAYFTKEEYGRAQSQFTFVHQREPTRENLGYYLGFIHFNRKEYEEALRFFEENVSTDIRFQQQNRFYTGLAKHHLGRDLDAIQDLREAVKLRPEVPLARTAKVFAQAITPRPEPRRYRIEVLGGVSYDDNATLTPTGEVLGLRTADRRSAAEIAQLRLEYDLIRTQPDTLTASYQLYSNVYNSVDNLGVLNHTWTGDYIHRARLRTLPAWYGAQYSYDYLELDGAVFLSQHTGFMSLTLFENDSNFTIFQARFQEKDFRSPDTLGLPEEARDGQNYMVGATHIMAFAGGRHFLRFGYEFDAENTVGTDYEYFGQKAAFGFQVTGPWDVRFQLGYDFQFRDYPNKNELASGLNRAEELAPGTVEGARFNVMRRDSDHIITMSLARDFPHGLSASLDFFKERNSSTFSLFDFDRNVVTFSVGWKY